MTDQIKIYQKVCGELLEALQQYADPEFYHAVAFVADRPAGGFADDFERKHGHPAYPRAMPGRTARRAIKNIELKHPDLVVRVRG